jgi:hypothetical protein
MTEKTPAVWAKADQTEEVAVDRVILRSENELVIDFLYDECQYTATLTRTTGNEFHGKYTTQEEGRPYEGNIWCRFFTLTHDVFLFGHWAKGGENYFWWADLDAVEHFPDEG